MFELQSHRTKDLEQMDEEFSFQLDLNLGLLVPFHFQAKVCAREALEVAGCAIFISLACSTFKPQRSEEIFLLGFVNNAKNSLCFVNKVVNYVRVNLSLNRKEYFV